MKGLLQTPVARRILDGPGDKGGTNRYLSDEQLEWLSKNVDAVVCTSGDCGSCTSWLIRDRIVGLLILYPLR